MSVVEQGAKRDVLVILLANALIIPLCRRVGLSPVLGFLAAGVALGPNCLSVVSDVKAIEVGARGAEGRSRAVPCIDE